MAPKKKHKKKPMDQRFRCDQVEGEQFHAPAEEVFRYNWWEVFCFPYILCSRLWDCFVTLCSGTNQCLVYWMMIQWLVCKITRMTTPDPIIFPYYFYMFCQVIMLTVAFCLFWHYWLRKNLYAYLWAFYEAMAEDSSGTTESAGGLGRRNTTMLSFRRYCFRKGEIFDSPPENTAIDLTTSPSYLIAAVTVDFFVERMFH